MRAFTERRDRQLRAARRLHEAKEWIDGQSATKIAYREDIYAAEEDRRHQAAVSLQKTFRGWNGRQITADRAEKKEAATCIQRRMRGIIGRRIASEERWSKKQVVPTAHSLKLLKSRSRVVHQINAWTELYDPKTGGFWYMEKGTNRTTWEAPEEFNDSLTCIWDPWPVPYSSPCDKPCRKVFKTAVEYRSHRLHAHPWVCPACEESNPALTFPSCEMCGNNLGPGGEDLEEKLRKDLKKALFEMRHAIELEDLTVISSQGEESVSMLQEEYDPPDPQHHGNDPPDSQLEVIPGVNQGIGGGGTGLKDGSAQPAQAHQMKDTCPGWGQDPFSLMGTGKPPRRKDTKEGRGVLEAAMGSAISCFAEGNEEVEHSQRKPGAGGAAAKSSGGGISTCSLSWMTSNAPSGILRVCNRFREGRCNLTTCPLAHPGLRDDAKLERLNKPGSRGAFSVQVCQAALAAMLGEGPGCPKGKLCSAYHPYVRPSTAEIIERIYPKKNGMKTKVFPSGAIMKGSVVNGIFQGFGVYTWPDGSCYMGEWRDGQRQGKGMFRGRDGREYMGHWERDVRHSHGVLTHPNGETYEGEFFQGRPHGAGLLTSAGGDQYSGLFSRGVPNGIGCLKRKNGDKFMGTVRDGRAQGMGVVAYAGGEKYKGDFRDDMRCGRGVCSYPDGSRFAGHWHRNMPDGFGIFIHASGGHEHRGGRYVGEWKCGEKHGYGRYVFPDGLVYDGDFQHDKACGKGVFREGDGGDWYRGTWENDRRHGRGTYQWATGSRYEGYWKEGNVDGKGILKYSGGEEYRGEFRANKKHGQGAYTWTNGNKYKGEFCGGTITGFGEMVYKTSGHRYLGQWLNNNKHGKGTFWYSDGNVYKGTFHEDDIHGWGRLTISPGTILEESYEGGFSHGIKHGYGTYRYPALEGMVYEGDWDQGLRHGRGTLRFKDGSFYKGSFCKEQKHGMGCMVWCDGSQYEGRWENNQRHGEGSLLHPDGSIFQGKFWRDKKHGEGAVTFLDGNRYEGVWEHDKVVGRQGRFTLLPGQSPTDVVHLRVFGY